MKTDNRSNGGRFEQRLASLLSSAGFWCHVMQQNSAGQPADIIAVKGKFHTLIDCKVVSDERGFPFSRIEENQRYAMRLFQKLGGELCYFAIQLPDETIWMVPMERMEILRGRGNRRLTEFEIRTQTCPLEKWLEKSRNWKGVKDEYDNSEPDIRKGAE